MIVTRSPAKSLRFFAGRYSPPAGAAIILVAFGIALRTWEFCAHYSLNHDDICLALNLMTRSTLGLMRTLDFDQAAPLGFLWIEHAMVRLLGPGEQALRLLPFFFGCVSVVLMALLATTVLPTFEAIAALGFFVFSQPLIESCIQVKPYSLNVMVTIVLVSACLPLLRDCEKPSESLVAALAGAVALWFSFPAFFLLGGMGAVIAWRVLVNRESAMPYRVLAVLFAWSICAVCAYWFSMRSGMLNSSLAHLDSAFMFPVHEWTRILPWTIAAVTNLGLIGTSVRLAPLAGGAFLFALALTLRGRDQVGLLLAAPIGLCLFAAIAQKYPWLPRLIFFTAPLTLIMTAREVGLFVRERSRVLRNLAASIVALAFIYAGLSVFKNIVVYGNGFDDPRGAVAAIAKQWRPGDRIYADGAAMPCIIYYREILHVDQLNFVSSRKAAYTPGEIERIVPLPKTQGRLWFLYFDPDKEDYDQQVLTHFHKGGSLIFRSRYKNFVVALWNLDSGLKPAS